MNESIVTEPPRRSGKLIALLAVLATPAVIAGVIVLAVMGGGPIASPATMIGQPVRASTAGGDRAYVLTSQWKSYKKFSRGLNNPTVTDLLIDVWAFDAADARPVWRHRLLKQRAGVNDGRKLLGADGGVLWVLQPSGLSGLSLETGKPVVDVAKIEAANPGLRGLLPTEQRYYRFDAAGMAFTAADGRFWRLDGKTLAATPAVGKVEPRKDVSPAARIAGGVGTSMFQVMGLDLENRWLGLGAVGTEPVDPRDTAGRPPPPPRLRLGSRRVTVVKEFLGPQRRYGPYAPLPESPEFLMPGLLTNGNVADQPVLLFKPDSVLVLHTDRLGDQGRLQLTRVSGPLGKVVWTLALPMQRLTAVMPGEGSLVLLGQRDEAVRGDNLPASIDQLVAIDAATGRMKVYGFKVMATKAEDIPASSTEEEGVSD